MNEEEEDKQRIVPQSDLDFQQLITDPVWGQNSVLTPELKNKLGVNSIVKHYKTGDIRVNPETGNPEQIMKDCSIVEPINLWGQLGFLTRDLRLGNLDKNELDYVRDDIDLAYAMMEAGMVKGFTWLAGEVGCVSETSHMKNGWFRNNLNTFRTEKREEIYTQPEKKDWLGRKK